MWILKENLTFNECIIIYMISPPFVVRPFGPTPLTFRSLFESFQVGLLPSEFYDIKVQKTASRTARAD